MTLCKDAVGPDFPCEAANGSPLCGLHELVRLAAAWRDAWTMLEALVRAGTLDDTLAARGAVARFANMLARRLAVLERDGIATSELAPASGVPTLAVERWCELQREHGRRS